MKTNKQTKKITYPDGSSDNKLKEIINFYSDFNL